MEQLNNSMADNPYVHYFATVENGKLAVYNSNEKDHRCTLGKKKLGQFEIHESYKLAKLLVENFELSGYDLGMMCSSTVDFADEDGWPVKDAGQFIELAQDHAKGILETDGFKGYTVTF